MRLPWGKEEVTLMSILDENGAKEEIGVGTFLRNIKRSMSEYELPIPADADEDTLFEYAGIVKRSEEVRFAIDNARQHNLIIASGDYKKKIKDNHELRDELRIATRTVLDEFRREISRVENTHRGAFHDVGKSPELEWKKGLERQAEEDKKEAEKKKQTKQEERKSAPGKENKGFQKKEEEKNKKQPAAKGLNK